MSSTFSGSSKTTTAHANTTRARSLSSSNRRKKLFSNNNNNNNAGGTVGADRYGSTEDNATMAAASVIVETVTSIETEATATTDHGNKIHGHPGISATATTMDDDNDDDDDGVGARGSASTRMPKTRRYEPLTAQSTDHTTGGAITANLTSATTDLSYYKDMEEKDGLMKTTTTAADDDDDDHHHQHNSNRTDRYGRDDDDVIHGTRRRRHHYDVDHDSQASETSEDTIGAGMSVQELIYSSSSYYAIAKPVTLTMILSALAVCWINNDETRAEGAQAMASAYLVFGTDRSSSSTGQNLALSLANALVMVSVICAMTFVVVLLYRMKLMMCLIGYMILCSGTLLGILGGNLLQVAIHIYRIPVDKVTFGLFIFNFCIVGVIAVFFGQGIPKYVTQGYLIATAVILAWHLSYFDDWTTWTLLFMLALYDLCAVLTPCGPLKALVEAMSQEDSPDMPGLLFEAELPPEAKRPGVPRNTPTARSSASAAAMGSPTSENAAHPQGDVPRDKIGGASASNNGTTVPGPTVKIPLAIAKVYQLNVISVPAESKRVLFPQRYRDAAVSASPLLRDDDNDDENATTGSSVNIPENPTPQQLRATVIVRLPMQGGRIEQVSRRGKKVYLERDRFGNPKRLLWVDRAGKVFAEMREDDEHAVRNNSIRLGLGDFIFYSVLVAKAAQYSFSTFAACTLVILAGLGGTLVLLSVYHSALPALPISIFLGVLFYLLTRWCVEPWMEVILSRPYYV